MKKFILSTCMCLISIQCTNAMKIQQRQVKGKILLSTIASKQTDLYQSGSLNQTLFFDKLHIRHNVLNKANRKKVVTTQENLDKAYLEMQIPQKMKFLYNSDEKERVTQIVQRIVERFNSELLGFSNAGSRMFFNDTPIQQFEDLCTMYDIEDLITLENIQSLKSVIEERMVNIESYPNIKFLFAILNKR